MSSTHVAILGAIAGFTIYLGLPLGRVRGSGNDPAPRYGRLIRRLADAGF